MTDGVEPRGALLAALAAPGVCLLAVIMAVLIAALAGVDPSAAPEDLSLAEAAAVGDGAEVLRQIQAGADPSARVLVRRGFVSDPEFLLTPLEAATAASHAEVVRLLVDSGAAIGPDNAAVLICLAEEQGSMEILSYLRAHAPAAPAGCAGVRLPL